MDIQIFGQNELESRIRRGKPVYSHLISIGNPGNTHQDEIMPEIFKVGETARVLKQKNQVLKAENESFLKR